MGVRKLFSYIKRRYRYSILRKRTRTVKIRTSQERKKPSEEKYTERQKEETKEVPIKITGYGIDGNALLHTAAQWAYGYGIYQGKAQDIPDTIDPFLVVSNPDIKNRKKPTATIVAERFIYLLEEGWKLLDPERKTLRKLYIAIDGPAPLAKAQQQRTRRYLAAARTASEDQEDAKDDIDEGEIPTGKTGSFDSSVISPGTPFMDEIDEYIRKWLKDNLDTLPIETIYWSHRTQGEGEHKLIDAFSSPGIPRGGMSVKGGKKVIYKEDEHDVIYGNDNDLIILCLVRTQRTFILRDAFDNPNDQELIRNPPELGSFCLVDIDHLRRDLEKNYNLTMPDLSVLMLFLGNDFVPTTPIASDVYYTIDNLFELYRDIKGAKPSSKAGKVNPNFVLYDNKIHWDDLYVLISALNRNDREESFLLKRYEAEEFSNSERNLGYKGITKRIEKTEALWNSVYTFEDRTRVDVDKFRDLYWMHFLPGLERSSEEGEVVLDVVDAYLESFVWSTTYYVRGVSSVNVEWYYRYHYAPMLLEVRDVMKIYKEKGYRRWEITPLDLNGKFLNPLELEIAILPLNVLNDVLYGNSEELADELISKVFTPLRDLFPVQVKVDGEGQDIPDKAIVRLPFVDSERIRTVAKSLDRRDVSAVEKNPIMYPFLELKSGRTKTGKTVRQS